MGIRKVAEGRSMVQKYPVVWLQCATCTGCSVSALNSVSPTIKNLLVDEVIPGKSRRVVSARREAVEKTTPQGPLILCLGPTRRGPGIVAT